jgi:hypothetical protein
MGTGLERSTVIDAAENVMRSAPEVVRASPD